MASGRRRRARPGSSGQLAAPFLVLAQLPAGSLWPAAPILAGLILVVPVTRAGLLSLSPLSAGLILAVSVTPARLLSLSPLSAGIPTETGRAVLGWLDRTGRRCG
jgi:hypothetical protein